MKVLIIDSTPPDQRTYLAFYLEKLKERKIPYDIIDWVKTRNGEVKKTKNKYIIYQVMHLSGWKKYKDFCIVAKSIRKIIKRGEYTHLIIVNTIWAVFLMDIILSHFRNRYLLDIRDYKVERFPIIKQIIPKIVKNSYRTIISSRGFLSFLPECPSKYLVAHNIPIDKCDYKNKSSLIKNKKHINIGYIGRIRDDAANQYFIDLIKADRRYSLYYYGVFSPYSTFQNKEKNQIDTIHYMGRYNEWDKANLYKNIDMIHSIYLPTNKASKMLTPNRLYDALLYKKPLLVSAGTYLSEIVEKYELGVVIDFSKNMQIDLINRYVDTFDQNQFSKSCDKLLEQVCSEQEEFLSVIKEFINVD